MIGKLFMVSAEAAEVLVDDPTGILALLDAADEFETDSEAVLDLDKQWHVMHFLLTGDASAGEPPLNFLIAGGEEIGIDLGSGQVRLFDAAAVKRIDSALEDLARAEVVGRVDPAASEEAELYRGIGAAPLDELQREYGDIFDRLKAFVRQAAGSNRSLVATIL
jgi:hypothetical protein